MLDINRGLRGEFSHEGTKAQRNINRRECKGRRENLASLVFSAEIFFDASICENLPLRPQ